MWWRVGWREGLESLEELEDSETQEHFEAPLKVLQEPMAKPPASSPQDLVTEGRTSASRALADQFLSGARKVSSSDSPV